MKLALIRMSGAVLILGFIGYLVEPASAVPIKNPDNCQGPVTIGVATCSDKPGHWVECIPSGDYMCCTQNAQGGKDCEQIEAKHSPVGGIRAPLGNKLQVAPGTMTPPTRYPKTGVTAPIMRRGVEGEQGDEQASPSGGGDVTGTEQGK